MIWTSGPAGKSGLIEATATTKSPLLMLVAFDQMFAFSFLVFPWWVAVTLSMPLSPSTDALLAF